MPKDYLWRQPNFLPPWTETYSEIKRPCCALWRDDGGGITFFKTMTGKLDILSCGDGHLEIKFHENDVIECARAKRIIQDMLKRGYALFVHGKDDALIRVKKFMADKNVYIIADGPTIPPETEPAPVKGGRALKIHKAKATVVGRSAGG